MDEDKLIIKYQILSALFCCGVFSLVYNFCAFYTSTLNNVESFNFNFENYIPFIPTLIIPYMSNGILFILMPFFCTNQNQLKQYVARIIALTIVAGILYLIFPLKFAYQKPTVDSPLLNYFFSFLVKWDSPFNQAPSLHVGYALIFWSVLIKRFSGITLTILKVWLLLIIFSTIFVYQHHVIDVFVAIILTQIIIIFTNTHKYKVKYRNQYIAQFYLVFGTIFFLIGLTLIDNYHWSYQIAYWISINLYLVGNHYRIDNSNFIKNQNGEIKFWKKIVYLPYLLAYYLMWLYNRKIEKNSVTEIFPQVYTSAKLTSAEYKSLALSKKDFIIDLSAELPDNKWIKQNCKYLAAPILDIGISNKKQIKKTLTYLLNTYRTKEKDSRIFIHCTMGYSRSSMLAILFLKNILNIKLERALQIVSETNKSCVINRTTKLYLNSITL